MVQILYKQQLCTIFRQLLEDLSSWVLPHTAEALLIARWPPLAVVSEMALGSPQQSTYLPFALCKVLLNLSADRWVYVTVKGCISINPADGERRKWARRQMAFVRHSTFGRQLTALYVQSAIIKPKGETATKCNTNTHFKAWKSSGWDFFFASVYGGKYAQIASLIIHHSLHAKKKHPGPRRDSNVNNGGGGDPPCPQLPPSTWSWWIPVATIPGPLTMGAAGLPHR